MLCLSLSYIVNKLYILFVLFIAVATFLYCADVVSNKISVAKSNFVVFSLTSILVILPGLLIKDIHPEYFKQAIIMFAMICSGFLLAEMKAFNLFLSRLPFFVISLYYFALHVHGVPMSYALSSNSENFVSVSLFLAYFLSFALSKKYQVEFIVLIMAGVILFLSVISIGRSGIVTSAFLFIFTALLYFHYGLKQLNPRLMRASIYLFFLSFAYFAVSVSLQVLLDAGLLERIVNRGFTDYSRWFIISDYFSRLYDLRSLLGGVDVYLVDAYSKYGYNLHNSYLSIHSIFGLAFFIIYTLLLVQVSFWLVLKKNAVLLIPWVAILVRALTDIQVLGGKLDWVLYFLVFIQLQGVIKRNRAQQEK